MSSPFLYRLTESREVGFESDYLVHERLERAVTVRRVVPAFLPDIELEKRQFLTGGLAGLYDSDFRRREVVSRKFHHGRTFLLVRIGRYLEPHRRCFHCRFVLNLRDPVSFLNNRALISYIGRYVDRKQRISGLYIIAPLFGNDFFVRALSDRDCLLFIAARNRQQSFAVRTVGRIIACRKRQLVLPGGAGRLADREPPLSSGDVIGLDFPLARGLQVDLLGRPLRGYVPLTDG